MQEHLTRKLVVILHADVVGSTVLVQQNETLAHERIQAAFQRFSETIKHHDGVAHELRGDALVAEFERASDAISAALTYQAANTEFNATLNDEIRPRMRIGISLGEVVIADNTITGAGVVLAQRLEQLAESGGVCIQGAAYETVPQRLPFEYKNLGEQQVKGFDEPVRAYAVMLISGEEIPVHEPTHAAVETLHQHALKSWLRFGVLGLFSLVAIALAWWQPWEKAPTRADAQPSIAVLPFQTLSDDPTQEYFSDGVTNDIITDLSKFSNLLVIASTSVFVYKEKPINIKEIGQELGVRYVLEGSIQKAGDRVRINAQLIDATTDHHIWAERYDFPLDDVFKVQDEITSTVISSLQVILTEEEQSLSAIRHTDVIEAYDLYLRGRTYLRGTKQSHLKARQLFNKAIKLDPNFAAAYAEKSFTYFSSFIMPMSRDPKVVKGALKAAERAVELDDTLPLAYARLSWAYFATRQHARAVTAARRAVALGPNDAEANVQLGNILNWSGKPAEGKQYIERAIRLNPLHPYYYLFYLGQSYYLLEENDKAIELMKRVVTRAPYFLPVRRHLAVLYSEKGMMKEAKAETKEVLRIFPGASLVDERARCFYRWTPDVLKRFFTGLRKSGMPEGKVGEEPISM
jgi:TolB-like protein/class 3 adenylate cyclase